MSDTKNDFKPSNFEEKWQKEWEDKKLFSPDLKNAKKPFYNLMMFPYPSAEGLHVGNMYAFTGADVYGRYQRMQGNDVFEPIGLDGFGIHSENYALKIGKHPREQAQLSEKNFYRQLRSIGNSFDWQRTLETYDPEYYRWTQWLFVQLFKNGLAYRKKAEVNWCPKDLTVLSDEQVIDGKCERCGSVVEKRELEQWFFRITKYAERLLNNIDKLDWSERVKIAQKQWIGKSDGAQIKFALSGIAGQEDGKHSVEVFTTRPDTLFGATFLVISPELAKIWLGVGWKANAEVIEYVEKAIKKDQKARTEDKEKTGVFAGIYATNPANQEKIPVWVADYVLSGYGTGAIMAVPAHDGRDFEFAKKFDLPIKYVISGGAEGKVYEEDGEIINSNDWNGWVVPQEIGKVNDWLEQKGFGKKESNYHLRDWLISRQRYWGPPIPMTWCETCEKNGKGEREEMPGWYSVPEAELPVLLPDVEDWKPVGTGLSPLANHPEFYETKCPGCGGMAKRETDVSDTFLDSAWYFLRYTSIDVESNSYDTEIVKKWLPVPTYIGGAEHSVLHLLYSRFITMVLADLKMLDFEEPFTKFFAHGLIIKDGVKMSKSKGNVVVPDEYIKKYGADTLRMYLMFIGPFSQGGDFRDSGIEGMHRFVKRVWKLFESVSGESTPEGVKFMHKTIKVVTEDISKFSYNTSIARLMEWYNFLTSGSNNSISKQEAETFLKLLAPLAPHITEELWKKLGNSGSIHQSAWPTYDEKFLEQDEVTIAIQINGKMRGTVVVSSSLIENKEKVETAGKEVAAKYIADKKILKVIYVPGKVVNFVI